VKHSAVPGRLRRPASDARRRVCILRQSDIYEHMVKREAEALSDAGFDVEVILMQGDGRPRHAVVNHVTVISLPASRRRGGSKARYAFDYARFFMLAAVTLTVRHVRRPYHVIQAYSMPDFLAFAALFPKLLGSRVIAYMGEPTPELAETLFGPGLLPGILARIEQWTLRFADHSITVTEQLKQRYVERGARGDQITVVLNGSDPATMLAGWSPTPRAEGTEGTGAAGKETRRFTVVCHGTIEDRYGQDTIIEAARLLRDEMPDLRVFITGRGSRSAEVAKTIADHGLAEIVRFEGWVSPDRLNDILNSADAGIVAQKSSPYSHLVHTNKMVDYWMFGLPVIASRLRATAETYGDDVIEYFEPGDAAALAAAIRRLRAAPHRRAELAGHGELALRSNGWSAQRAAYLGAFAAVLADSTGRTADQPAVAGG
jgi:glycosyltransferase involved in cell wall biosynthesis